MFSHVNTVMHCTRCVYVVLIFVRVQLAFCLTAVYVIVLLSVCRPAT